MGDMAGLPALSDPRLTSLQKQSKRIRKGTTILNDKLRAQRDISNKVVDKNKASDGYRSWQKSMPYKHSLAEIRGIQKCLKKRRESATLDPEMTPRNGIYDGLSLDSMRLEVDKVIQEKNPRERRLRKVERIKNNGYRDGRIVDYNYSMAKFSDVLHRPKGIERGERPVSSFDAYEQLTASSRSPLQTTRSPALTPGSPSAQQTSMGYSPVSDSPPHFRLPPIQARRSTIANMSMMTQPRRLFDTNSNRSDPCRTMKRSMSFAIAQ
ncbi:uncharacterized protein LOC101845934 [Aplysia californica]|uniref:Uncharacterized protein LOC101845934 n=1 Tax=Aplysia californica TaxID=6500 RepID=A0ABM0JTB5_APLCA|nr:uncharacterized protein LOC101845934 [Aplysia californica]